MRDSENFDVQDANETDLLRDPEYLKWADSYDEETRRAIDKAHQSCSIENSFGMCGECEAAYRKAKKIGADDFGMGIELTRGMAVWLAFHPELPRVYQGAREGYAHGYSKAMLHSLMSCSGMPIEEAD